jgi:hypothetical protein
MTSRKKPGVAFWATVILVAALVGYPLSTGPADWMRNHGWLSEGAIKALDWFYAPLPWTYKHSPTVVQRAIRWYASVWH